MEVSASLSPASGAQVEAAVRLPAGLAVMARAQSLRPGLAALETITTGDLTPEPLSVSSRFVEGALGYHADVGPDSASGMFMSVYAGYGRGRSEGEGAFLLGYETTEAHVERVFVQPTLGVRLGAASRLTVSLRAARVGFADTYIRRSSFLEEPRESTSARLVRWYGEPAAGVALGYGPLLLRTQLGVSVPLGEAAGVVQPTHVPFICNVGVTVRLDDFFR
jgi:hypothetical protein